MTDAHQRIVWAGEHKNATRAVVTRRPSGLGGRYLVEMWQRPEFGVPYASASDSRLRYAWNACSAALDAYAKARRDAR